MQANGRDNLGCDEVRRLIPLHVKDDPSLSESAREAFESHLLSCDACRQEYMEEFSLVQLLRENWGDVSPRTQALVGPPSRARRPTLLTAIKLSAIAAGVVLAIGFAWRVYVEHTKPGAVGPELPPPQIATVSPAARPAALGELYTAGREPTEILLGGMHRVVMNSSASAVFRAEPSPAGQQFEIDLRSGELYVEVVKGHPFEVKTGNARISIMGTRFDVMTQEGKTDLVMLEGKVRFAGRDDSNGIEVAAGFASAVTGRQSPTEPRPVDALAATAWARNLALANAVSRAATGAADLSDMLKEAPLTPDLRQIEYADWLRSHRDWFAREFPWIFIMQTVLKDRHAIEADYIDLLIATGDIWQFHYAGSWKEPIATFDPSCVQRVCERYSLDPAEMTQALASYSRPGIASPTAPASPAQLALDYLSALRRWQADLAQPRKCDSLPSELMLFSLRAGTYLSHTRTAAWLWVREHPDDALLSSPQWLAFATGPSGTKPLSPQQWLDRLSADISAVGEIDSAARELLVLPDAVGCEAKESSLTNQLRKSASALTP